MYYYLFETNTQNAFALAEKYNLSEYDREYILHNYWPIIKVNNYDTETIKEKLDDLKKEFIKENTIFDLEIFNRENTALLIYELNQYIDILKRGKVKTWDKYDDDFFHIFKTESDIPEKILLISDKNITKLEVYFKSILNIIQKFINPETINLQNSTKTENGVIEDFEINKDLSQTEVRRSIRTHIKINYELSLKEFLQTNHLADEIFYINFIDKNQKEQLHELEKEVSFFDMSEGEKVTDDIADQWYNEKITRDHYWYYKEYQTFLKERLTELEKIKTIEKSKKFNFDITKEVYDFEVFSNNFETEITTLFNQNIQKNEKLNTYYKDYLPKYLTRINELISHTEQMQNEFKLYFPDLEIDLQNLNTITSKFKKSILNDLETTLNTVLKIDYERLLFEYLNITNKLETDLKIEGKKISTLFEIFYNRMLHIKSNPKPQQPEPETLDLSDTSAVKKTLFTNNFDNVEESIVYQHFKTNLVDKKHISETDLNKFLKLAFDKKELPQHKISFQHLKTQKGISNIFYNYYKITAGKPYGKQQNYINLLCNYFNGFEKLNIRNFSK